MYIEMELLARERYQSRLRDAEAAHRHRSLMGPADEHSRAPRKLPLPRMLQR
jgi:hypothetical protein